MREIIIEHNLLGIVETTDASGMAALAGSIFPVAERVPDVPGEAFDWHEWYRAWLNLHGAGKPYQTAEPDYLAVEAKDGFQATIPWEQLKRAAVLCELDGEPLVGAGPIRLYVPDGSSKCLNVKSVVRLRIGSAESAERVEAAYGFKNTFSVSEMRMKQ